jgi:hypothetical protein
MRLIKAWLAGNGCFPSQEPQRRAKACLKPLTYRLLKDRPQCACLQTALSKLAVGGLQRRFDALLQAGTLRLKAIVLAAGLIIIGTGFIGLTRVKITL